MVKIVLGGKKPQQGMQSQGNFGSPFGAKKAPVPVDNLNIKEDIGSLNRRVKMLEERYTNLRGKFQVTEQNMLTKNKNFFTDIKTINLELTEVKKEINEIKDKMLSLLKELESFAGKEQLDILKKYIDLWNPVKFVSRNEVEDIVREVIDRMRKEG